MESDATELPQRETVFPTAWSSGTMAPGSMAPGASQESGVRRRVKPTTGQVRREMGSEEVGGGEPPTPRSPVLTPTVPDVLGGRGRLALRPFLETRGPEPELTTGMTPSVPAPGHCC